MALPVSPNEISLNQVNVEMVRTATATLTMNDTDLRTVFDKPTALSTISMSDGHGKSYRKTLSYVFSANADRPVVALGSISGYVAGVSDITITVNAGVYIYSTTTATAALRITGGTTGDTLKLVCNGYIMGQGGAGAGRYAVNSTTPGDLAATAGGQAINSSWKFTQISGTGYIGGGGGGGGGNGPSTSVAGGRGGGGGAGGGAGGTGLTGASGTYATIPGAPGGGLGGSGTNGADPSTVTYGMAGGGGRTMPGSASPAYTSAVSGPFTYFYGKGGTAGGGGGGTFYVNGYHGGGGGGWGAAGGTGYTSDSGNPGLGGGAGNAGGNAATTGTIDASFPGAAGGAAIQTNSQGIGTVTCTVYGAIV